MRREDVLILEDYLANEVVTVREAIEISKIPMRRERNTLVLLGMARESEYRVVVNRKHRRTSGGKQQGVAIGASRDPEPLTTEE